MSATVTIVEPTLGTYSASGFINGTFNVPDAKAVRLPDRRMAGTTQVSYDLHYDFSGKAPDGSDFSFTARDGQSYNLAKFIGPLEFADDLGGTFHINGEDRDAFVQAHMAATAASLIPQRSSVTDGVLTIPGTPFDDSISVSGNASLFIEVNRIIETISAPNGMPVNVFGFDGSDNISTDVSGRGAYVDAGAGNDSVRGGSYPDTFTGGAGKDTLFGGGGDDRLAGNGGHDSIAGYTGNDRLYGGNENDTLLGGNGVDRIWGGAGDDVLGGDSSNDKLFGEAGNDALNGGNQDDRLDGGAGLDTLSGGAGVDTFAISDGFIDHADGGAATDLVTGDPDDVLSNI
jgi:Ca2+-binding RTX toxin-like protein